MIKTTCKQCGEEFILTDSELKFYKQKGLKLPKRCKDCRQKNKRENGSGKGYKKEGKPAGRRNFVDDYESVEIPYGATIERKSKSTRKLGEVLLFVILIAGAILGGTYVKDYQKKQTQSQTDATYVKDYQKKQTQSQTDATKYVFRNESYLQEHFAKHGDEFGYETAEEYLKGANAVIANQNSLHKLEAEDGDDVYYLEETKEFVVVSTDGYIRTYFKPDSGIAYYNRQ